MKLLEDRALDLAYGIGALRDCGWQGHLYSPAVPSRVLEELVAAAAR